MIEPLSPVSVAVRPTRVGWALLAVTALTLGLAWAGLGMPCSVVALFGGATVVVAAVASWWHASSIRIAAPAPVTAFAGERFSVDVPVANFATRAGAFDVLFSVSPLHAFRDPVGALLPRLTAGAETRVEVVYPMLRRGLHPQGTLDLASAFPLGLFSCRLRFALPHEILVLPRLGTIRRLDDRGVRMRGDTGYRGTGAGDEQEVYGVRAWREGESLRPVHWKLSARRGRLLVREFRNERRPPVHVVLETALATDSRRARGAFEDAVSLAASLVEHYARRGHSVRLTLLGRERRTIVCPRGRGALFPALRALAMTVAELRVPGTASAPPVGRRGERTYLVRVADRAVATAVGADGGVTVLDVPGADFESVFDRRRRPGRELLLGVRG